MVVSGHNLVLLHARPPAVREFMEQAKQLRMLGHQHHYIFTNLDAYTLDLDAYRRTGCNITTLRLVLQLLLSPFTA